MDEKGQIFTLDFLVSTTLIVIALGIAMQFIELKEIETREQSLQTELERVGNTAAELLVSAPDNICGLVDTGNITIGFVPNCIWQSQDIPKGNIGIPNNFNCRIKINGATMAGECQADPIDAKNIFAAERKIVQFNGPNNAVPKSVLSNCIEDNGCTQLAPATLTIEVWKA